MDNVVSIAKPDVMIFVCNCGCSSFSLLSDGSTECSACNTLDADQAGAWADHSGDKTLHEGDVFVDVQGNNSVEFARKRIGLLASDDDVALVLVAKDGGSVHAWCKSETEGEMQWMREKLQVGGDLIENASDLRKVAVD